MPSVSCDWKKCAWRNSPVSRSSNGARTAPKVSTAATAMEVRFQSISQLPLRKEEAAEQQVERIVHHAEADHLPEKLRRDVRAGDNVIDDGEDLEVRDHQRHEHQEKFREDGGDVL